jgi:hypothetical protein
MCPFLFSILKHYPQFDGVKVLYLQALKGSIASTTRSIDTRCVQECRLELPMKYN